jgi:flavoprotein
MHSANFGILTSLGGRRVQEAADFFLPFYANALFQPAMERMVVILPVDKSHSEVRVQLSPAALSLGLKEECVVQCNVTPIRGVRTQLQISTVGIKKCGQLARCLLAPNILL